MKASRTAEAHDLLHRAHSRVIGAAFALWILAGSLFIVMAIPALRDAIQNLVDAVVVLVQRVVERRTAADRS